MIKDFPFFKEEKSQIIINEYKVDVFIPKYYFEREGDDNKELAYIYGNKAETLGVLYFKVYKSDKDKGTMYLLNAPIVLNINVFDYQEDVMLDLDDEEIPYTVLTYEKGDVFINNLEIIVDPESIIRFIRLLKLGKVPKSIKYEEILETFINAMETSGVDLNIQATILEVVIAELCRKKNNLSESFRTTAATKSYTPDDYKMIPISEIPKFSSTFTGLIFERIKDSIITGINNTRQNKKQRVSPLEASLKY